MAATTWTPEPPHGTVRAIRQLGDPVLRTPARPVTEFDDALRKLIDDMFASMYAAQGVGLAANQIGVDLDLFVFDCPSEEEGRIGLGVPPSAGFGYVVNPVLDRTWGDSIDDEEGCLSLLGLLEPTPRAEYAAVSGVDVDGQPARVIGSGLLGRCLQHETDHLRGMIYLDRVPRVRRGRALRRFERSRAERL